MGKTFAYFKYSGKELVSRQLLRFFEQISAKNVPNFLIILAGMLFNFGDNRFLLSLSR